MRLIDADLLKKNCKCTGKFEDNFKGVDLIELAKVIDAQPTAYDSEEVLAELDASSVSATIVMGSHKINRKVINADRAISIVKAGGVDG